MANDTLGSTGVALLLNGYSVFKFSRFSMTFPELISVWLENHLEVAPSAGAARSPKSRSMSRLARLCSVDNHARWLRDILLFAEHFFRNWPRFANCEDFNNLF